MVPVVPYTLEGSYVLHQMMRIRWAPWKALPESRRLQIASEATAVLENIPGEQSAVYSVLGHKGDLMLLHFRQTLDQLNQIELRLARLDLADYLEPTSSYLSVVELGLYDSTARLYKTLAENGVEPDTPAWQREVEEELTRQRKAMESRLWPLIPPNRYLSFYPMDRRRGEHSNWYLVPFAERQRMMHLHGMIGRKYAGEVKQIITGSIGFDDWEWGVDLFSDDPLVFKKLIYEMRFDEVSAIYALFGSFYMGIRLAATDLPAFLNGSTPADSAAL